MKKHISNFIFKVNDILADPNSEIISISQEIPVWDIFEMTNFSKFDSIS